MSEFEFFIIIVAGIPVIFAFLYLLLLLSDYLMELLVQRQFKKHFLNDSSVETWCASREEYVNNTICCYDCDNCIYNER